MTTRAPLAQLPRFAVVGVGNTVLSLAAFALLARLGVPGPPASATAFLIGAANGYRWNRRWTFAAADGTATRVRYLVVQLAGVGLAAALVALFEHAGLAATPAYVPAAATVTLLGFVANRSWTFAATPQRAPSPVEAAPRMLVDVKTADRFSFSHVPTVEIVVPVHDEEAALAPNVRRLHAYLEREFPFRFHITVADNASRDGTWTVARRLARELPAVSALRLDRKGRGRALRAAWSRSGADVLAYMDVDLSTRLDALLPLVAPLLSGHSDLAIGTRLARSARVSRGLKRELISRAYNRILHAVLRVGFSDAQCGFKAVRRDALAELLPLVEDEAWFFDTELLVRAERAGLRIHEVPVDWIDDPDSRVDIVATAAADLRGVWRLLLDRRPGPRPAPTGLGIDSERTAGDLHAA
ncbi:MAG TPA: glycosyltransferase [Gaiellaceae bacterium]|nr:glycosyltransferase [Gaiellaceae bacterium]